MLKNTGDEMILNIEEREIFLYADNTYKVYRIIEVLINNYARKLAKGNLDATKAVKGFIHPVEAAVKEYAREFGGRWYDLLTVAERERVARALLVSYSDEIANRANEIKK